jgi:hypothetical protein
MRLLFLDINLQYVNPTRGLVPAMLRECADAVLYGPGYQPLEILEKGLESFIGTNGPFDFVVASEFAIPLHRTAFNGSRFKHHHLTFGPRSLTAMDDVVEWFSKYKGRKIGLLLESDVFNLREAQIAVLHDAADWYCVVWDRRMMESVNDSTDLVHEPYAGSANDNFFEFITANERRIIAFPHFVSDSEFAWSSLSDRDAQWNVPGASYYYRRLAREIVGRRGLLRKQFAWMHLYGLLSRVGLRPYSSRLLLSLYGAQFHEAIERSRYCYTCGSAQRMHIRKHFEIPARGSVLVTSPINGFVSMGFRDGVNCFVRMPNELVDLHDDLERNPELAQSVASAGRDLIWSTHRVSNRAQQLRASLDAIRNGAFAGCVWESGTWHVRKD